MADDHDKSQQTEEPTAKRLEQAREHGDVVKSTEVTAFILLGGGTLAIAMFGKSTAMGLAQLAEPVPGTARRHERGRRRPGGDGAALLLP